MTFASAAGAGFAAAMSTFGSPVRFRYFSGVINGSYYDDNITLTQSGIDLWVNASFQVIDKPDGSIEQNLMQQGLLQNNDVRLFVAGSIQTSGAFKVGIGSPIRGEYSLTEAGVQQQTPNDTAVYKKIYLRHLSTGSLMGE